jgi:tetratricopeptide (TPR) repeat protein
MLMDFNVYGSTLTGNVGHKALGQNEISEGKIENNKISFYVRTFLMNRYTVAEWEGTIIGDKIHFTSLINGTTLNFIARKVEVDEESQEKKVQLLPTEDPSGNWIMKLDIEEYMLAFKASGTSFIGVIKISPQNETILIPDGKIRGDTISFSVSKQIGPRHFLIPWVGKVAGNEIHFEGGPFNQFENVIAKKVEAAGNSEDRVPIKLFRNEEIKKKKVYKKYKKLRKKDSEYDAAMVFFDQYQYHLAMPRLEQLYTRLPKDAVLLYRLGVCLIMESIHPDGKEMRARARGLLENAKKRGLESEMLEYYLEVIPEDGGESDCFSKREEIEKTLTEAEINFALRDFQNCIGLYAKTMEMDPTNYEAVLYIGDSYYADGQYIEAIEWFERATKVDPDKETAWRYWGDCLINLGKKDESRVKIIDALIAEPYNRLSWSGVYNLIELIKRESKRSDFGHITPDIQRPQRLEVSEKIVVAEKISDDSNDDNEKYPPDGTDAWSYYYDVVSEWRSGKFKEKYPDEEEYRHTLEEEMESLELVAAKVNEDIIKGRVKSDDLNPGIKTLLELQASGLLEPYILFNLADNGIIKDYSSYRESNRDKLEQYLDRFEVPKEKGDDLKI